MQLPQNKPSQFNLPQANQLSQLPQQRQLWFNWRPLKTENYLANYNDPQEINSLADAILTTFNPNMKRTSWFGLEDIPILNIIPATVSDLMINKTIKPLAKKQYGTAGLNLLINLAETLDVVANPIKAGLQGYGFEGIKSALVGDSEGRRNYDYQTGNIISDIGAEIISDPINWLTLFGKGIVTSVAKETVQGAVEKIGRDVGVSLSQDATKRLAKVAMREYLNGNVDGMAKALSSIARTMKTPLPVDFIKNMDIVATAITDHMSTTVLKGAQSVIAPSETFAQRIFKGAMASSGFGIGWWGLRHANTWVSNFIQEQSLSVLKPFQKFDGHLSFSDYNTSKLNYEQKLKEMSLTNRLTGHPELSPEIHTLLLRQSVVADKNYINAVLRKYANQPEKIRAELYSYFKFKHNVNTIEEYTEIIKDVNRQTNNLFRSEQNIYENLAKHLAYLEVRDYKIMSDVVFDVANDALGAIQKTLTIKFSPIVQSGLKVQEASNHPNFATRMEAALSTYGGYKGGYGAEDIYDDLEGVLKDYLETQIVPTLKELEVYAGRLPYFKDVHDQLQKAIYTWSDDMLKQLKIFADKAEQTGSVYNYALKYNKKHTHKQIERIITEAQNKLLAKQKTFLDAIPSGKGTNIESFLRKAESQQAIGNAIQEANVNNVTKIQKINPSIKLKNIKQIQIKLNNIFGRDIERWVEVYAKTFDTYPEGIVEVVNNFKMIKDLTDMDAYQSAYDDLQRLVHKLIRKNKEIIIAHKQQIIYKNLFKDIYIIQEKINKDLRYDHLHNKFEYNLLNDLPKTLQEIYKKIAKFSILDDKDVDKWNKLYSEFKLKFITEDPQNIYKNMAIYLNLSPKLVELNNAINKIKPELIERKNVYDEFNPIQDTLLITSNEFQENLLEIEELLSAVKPYEVESAKLKLTADEVNIQLKYEHLYSSLSLLNIEILNQIITDINTNKTAMAWFINHMAQKGKSLEGLSSERKLVNQAVETCAELTEKIQQYNYYREFIENIFQTGTQEDVRNAFLSQLQKYRDKNPIHFYNSFGRYIEEIFQNIEDYLNSTKMRESLSIDKLIETLKIKDTNIAHTAAGDIVRLEKIIEARLADEFNNPYINDVIVDIETTSLNFNSGSILEIAFKNKNSTQVPELKRLITKDNKIDIPQDSLLNKFFPDEPDKLSAFYKRFSSGDDERIMLEKFLNQIKQLPPNSRLVMHNGDRFDTQFIIERMKYHKLDTTVFEKITKVDTYKMLKEKMGYKVLSDEERNLFKHHLGAYTELLKDETTAAKLINVNVGDMAKAFLDLSRDCQNASIKEIKGFEVANNIAPAQLAQEFATIGRAIYDELQLITRINQAYRDFYINKSWATSDDGRYVFAQVLQETLGLSAKEVYDRFGDYLNMSKLLYSLTDGANLLGYKNVIDHNKIIEYFKFNLGETIDFKTAKALTSLARGFDNALNSIKNPWIINKHADEIKRMLKFLVPDKTKNQSLSDIISARLSTQVSNFLGNIRTDKLQALSNWVMLQYIYRQYKRLANTDDLASGFPPGFFEQFSPELIKLLDNPGVVKGYVKSGTQLSHIDGSAYELIDGELIARSINKDGLVDMRADQNIIDSFEKQTVKDLDVLATLIDENNLFRAKAQALAADARVMEKLLRTYASKFDELNFKQKQELYKSIQQYTNNLAEQETYNILTLPREQLRAFLAWEAEMGIRVNMADLMKQPHFQQVFTDLLKSKAELEALDIGIKAEGTELFIWLKKEARLDSFIEAEGIEFRTIRGERIERPVLKELDLEYAGKLIEDKELLDALNKSRKAIHRLSEDKGVGSIGNVVNKGFYEAYYDSLPKFVKDSLPNKEFLMDNKFYKTTRFNYSNLGTMASRRKLQTKLPSTIIDLYKSSTEHAALHAKTRVQYTQLYYDSPFSINNGWMAKGKISDEELIEAFKRAPHFVLTALVEDPTRRHGYRVIQIKPTTPQLLEQARRLNAVVMPYQTFSKAFETINQGKMNDALMNFIHKIVYTFKVGYLLDPGVIMRNFIDSTVKNMITTESFGDSFRAQREAWKALAEYDKAIGGIVDFDHIVRVLQQQSPELQIESAQYTALKMIQEHDQALDDIMKMDSLGRITKENIDFYFQHMNRDADKELFEFVHGYIYDGPSAGLTSELQKYFIGEPEGAWGTFVHISNKLMLPNRTIEQVNRLAEYILLTERGLTKTEAFYKIAKTHFDYALKSDWEKMIEVVFPFYTFTMKNIEYWVDAITQYPWLAPLFNDIMKPIWNMDEPNYDELKKNRSLQYQILSGNIPLTESGLTLKTAPSFMDVFNIATNPIAAVESKMFAPLTLSGGVVSQIMRGEPVEQDWVNLLPVGGAFTQRYLEAGPKYYERTGSVLNTILPGVFGATLRYTPKLYDSNQKPGKGYRKRPRKAWNVYPRKVYPKKVYARKVYAKKIYYPNYYHRFKDAPSFYKDIYTKTGKSRFMSRLKPVTSYTLKYRIKDFHHYFK